MIVGPVDFRCNNKLLYADYVLNREGWSNSRPFFYIRFLVRKDARPVIVLSNFQYSTETSVTNINEGIASEFYLYIAKHVFNGVCYGPQVEGLINVAGLSSGFNVRDDSVKEKEDSKRSAIANCAGVFGAIGSFFAAMYEFCRYRDANFNRAPVVTHDDLNQYIWIERYPEDRFSSESTVRVEFKEGLVPIWQGSSMLGEIYKYYPRELIEIDFHKMDIMLPYNMVSFEK